MQNKKYVIGLTGQSGAGKTTVSNVFKENGYEVINADMVARELQSNAAVVAELVKMFGDTISNDGISLNRKALADIVFSNKEKLKQLNDFMFPFVTHSILQKIEKTDKKMVLLDAPQLFESGAYKMCCFTIAVIAPKDILINRIMNRDSITREMAEKRLKNQYSEEYFKEHSDWVIENAGTEEELKKYTQYIVNSIKDNCK